MKRLASAQCDCDGKYHKYDVATLMFMYWLVISLANKSADWPHKIARTFQQNVRDPSFSKADPKRASNKNDRAFGVSCREIRQSRCSTVGIKLSKFYNLPSVTSNCVPAGMKFNSFEAVRIFASAGNVKIIFISVMVFYFWFTKKKKKLSQNADSSKKKKKTFPECWLK